MKYFYFYLNNLDYKPFYLESKVDDPATTFICSISLIEPIDDNTLDIFEQVIDFTVETTVKMLSADAQQILQTKLNKGTLN